jgi:TatA/E family protein of Tat protein translocase
MTLLFLEFLGTTEVLVILVVALLLFGPRKLPELSRSFGKSLAEFKRASEEFKQTWEKEVAMEEVEKGARIERAMIPEDPSTIGAPVGRDIHVMRKLESGDNSAERDGFVDNNSNASISAPSVQSFDAANADFAHGTSATSSAPDDAVPAQPTRKHDWL